MRERIPAVAALQPGYDATTEAARRGGAFWQNKANGNRNDINSGADRRSFAGLREAVSETGRAKQT